MKRYIYCIYVLFYFLNFELSHIRGQAGLTRSMLFVPTSTCRVTSSVYEVTQVNSVASCAQLCVVSSSCIAFNFITAENEPATCELVNVNLQSHTDTTSMCYVQQNITDNTHITIAAMTTAEAVTEGPSPCLSNPCMNQGTCNNLPNGRYSCTCMPGFSGPNCSCNCTSGQSCFLGSMGDDGELDSFSPAIQLIDPSTCGPITGVTLFSTGISNNVTSFTVTYANGSCPPLPTCVGGGIMTTPMTFDSDLVRVDVDMSSSGLIYFYTSSGLVYSILYPNGTAPANTPNLAPGGPNFGIFGPIRYFTGHCEGYSMTRLSAWSIC